MEYTNAEILEARQKLWRQGLISWKLDAVEKKLYDNYHSAVKLILTWCLSRRSGKSFTLLILAIEQCIQYPKSTVKYVASEQKYVRTIIKPLIEKILSDCPIDLKPKYVRDDSIYLFPNGSILQMAGCDSGRHEKLRGGDGHLCIVDEAGFIDELTYVVNSILLPTTTTTNGKIILSSTAPKTNDHEFVKYMHRAEANGTLVLKTIYDVIDDLKNDPNPRITLMKIDEIKAEFPLGGNDPEFLREYLCQVVQDIDRTIIPEWSEVEQDIIMEWIRPPFYDPYVSMDIGFDDLTFVVFGYYDFINSLVVIEDEVVINGPTMTTELLSKLIKDKEVQLWTNKLTNETKQPYLRICDNNLIMINDLYHLYGLKFQPAKKDDSDMALNLLRTKFLKRQIIINPKCKQLINHCKNGTWNKTRTSYMRSADNGHYDAIDAMKYLIRHMNWGRNPIPSSIRNTSNTFYKDTKEINKNDSKYLALSTPVWKRKNNK